MHKLSILSKGLSRRHFLGGMAVAAVIASTRVRAADFRYRLGSSQPADSPNIVRLTEMAERIRAETGGRMQIDIFPNGALGSDSAMLAMLQKNELEMYIAGNVLGPLVPVTEMPGLPFTFKNSAEVFAALDGELGDTIRAELLAKGLYAFRYGFDNG
jgi:TRAP-type C4-dicarboxylate transport system substrate-binding protein